MKTISTLFLAIAMLGLASCLNAALSLPPMDLAAGRPTAPVVLKLCGRYRHRYLAELIERPAIEATPEAV